MSRTPKRGVVRNARPAIHRRITTLEHDASGAIVESASRATSFSPAVTSTLPVGSVERRESDPAVMLGFVALVVACWLLAALFAVGLWLIT